MFKYIKRKLDERKRQKIADGCTLTFTKKWISRLMWASLIWISLSYILAFTGKESIAESLSQTIAEVVIATMLGYLAKSLFETKFEKSIELKTKEMELDSIENNYHESEDEAL